MTTDNDTPQSQGVLGQKYAFATASLVMGIACFVNLLGLEKALVAILFGWMALKGQPAPKLVSHRSWAITGVTLGAILLVLVPVLLLLNLERIAELIDALSRLSGGR
jgi:hypothetical protein